MNLPTDKGADDLYFDFDPHYPSSVYLYNDQGFATYYQSNSLSFEGPWTHYEASDMKLSISPLGQDKLFAKLTMNGNVLFEKGYRRPDNISYDDEYESPFRVTASQRDRVDLVIDNPKESNTLYTWEIACNSAFAINVGDEEKSQVSLHSSKKEQPFFHKRQFNRDKNAEVKPGQSLSLQLTPLNGQFPSGLLCRFNNTYEVKPFSRDR